MPSSRKRQVEELQSLQETLGDDKIIVGAGAQLASKVTEYVSTQCPVLDYMFGHPGIPVGRLTTLIGTEASGKSTVGLHLLAETQRRGGIAVLADSERRYWMDRAVRLGITDELLMQLQGETLEDVLRQIRDVIVVARKQFPDRLVTIVYDSIAGSPSKADVEADFGETNVAAHARELSRALRKLHPLIARERIALVLVNQLRHKVDFSRWKKDEMTMLGEKTLNYWSSLKVHLMEVERLGANPKRPTGIKVKAHIVKSTVHNPYRECLFDIDFQTGIDKVGSSLDCAVEAGIIVENKGWYDYKGRKFRHADFGPILEADKELQKLIAKSPSDWEIPLPKEKTREQTG